MAIVIPSKNIYDKTTNKVLKNPLKNIEIEIKNVDYVEDEKGLNEVFNPISNNYILEYSEDVNDSDATYRFTSANLVKAYYKEFTTELSRISEDDTNYYIKSASPTLKFNYTATVESVSVPSYPASITSNQKRFDFEPIISDVKTYKSHTNSYSNENEFAFEDTDTFYPDYLQQYIQISLGANINDNGISSKISASSFASGSNSILEKYSKEYSLSANDINAKLSYALYYPTRAFLDVTAENKFAYKIRAIPKIVVYVGCDCIAKDSTSAAISRPVKVSKITLSLTELKMIYGETIQTIDVVEKTKENITNETSTGNETISIKSDLIRTNNTYYGASATGIYYDTIDRYKNGKETATLLCSISDYYDYDDNSLVIAKNGSTGKMTFDIYDEVVPMVRNTYGQDVPMSMLSDGTPKKFSVLSARMLYDGAVWQELTLQEKSNILSGTKGLSYKLDDSKTYYICNGLGNSTEKDIIVSTRFNGLKVTQIGEEAFKDTEITSIYVPNSVVKIDDYAFQNCSQLSNITLNKGLENIGNFAFANLPLLEEITIPEGTKTLGASVFEGCQNLKNINPLNVSRNFGANALKGCESLESIQLNTVGSSATTEYLGFHFGATSPYTQDYFIPSSLKEVKVISSGTTQINHLAFYGCKNIERVTIGGMIEKILSTSFFNCRNLKELTLSKKVTSIGINAFNYCSNLTDVYYDGTIDEWNLLLANIGTNNDDLINATIHYKDYLYSLNSDNVSYTLTGIGDMPVGDMVILAAHNNLPITQIGNNAFKDTLIKSAILPNSIVRINQYAFADCKQLQSITLNETLDYIGMGAFLRCTNIKNIIIPNTVTYITDFAFQDCENLESITLSNNLSVIRASVFSRCKSLKNIIIPDKVTGIGRQAFISCNNLASVTLYNSLTSINEKAFANCHSLKNVYYFGTESQWNSLQSKIASGNDYLLNANIDFFEVNIDLNDDNSSYSITGIVSGNDNQTLSTPESYIGTPITNIKEEAFKNNENLKNVVIGNSILSIGNSAFRACKYITSISFGDNVQSIGDYAFYDCDAITAITIPNSTTYLGIGAFQTCANLQSVEIGSSLNTISSSAFRACPNLTSIRIPKSVKNISEYAFYACNKLSDVYYEGSLLDWASISIGSNNSAFLNATLHIDS